MARLRLIFGFVAFFCLVYLAVAPLLPHSIAGFIFSGGTKQVPIGTSYSVNDTNSSDFIRGRTNIPVLGFTGRYFESVQGAGNDTIVVMAWNSTRYGRTTAVVSRDLDNINVTLNLARAPELNLTITYPGDFAAFNIGSFFNVSARIKVLGALGLKCNTTISFSAPYIINISGTEFFTHSLGNPARNTVLSTFWNLSATQAGFSNITVSSACSNEGLYLEATKTVTLRNIQGRDTIPPTVRLVYPANNSMVRKTKSFFFFYNVSDASTILNCSLFLNQKLNRTNSSPVLRDRMLNFSLPLKNGRYNWSVRCFDSYKNMGSGGTFNFTIAVFPPHFRSMRTTSPVSLRSGSFVNVTCNATVINDNNASDLVIVNATLFALTVKSTAPNDNNYHYSDPNCTVVKRAPTSINVTCSFGVLYYANSGPWACNMTARTVDNLTNSSYVQLTVDDLYAIGASTFLDFGALPPALISAESNLSLYNYGNKDINVTIEAYGRVRNDNLSLACWPKGNISVSNERYSLTKGTAFASMHNASSNPQTVNHLVLSHRTTDNIYSNDTNLSYWRVLVPAGLKGACNGTLIIGAISP